MGLVSSIALNAFIVFLLLVFFTWDLPEHAFVRRLVHRFSKPIIYCGLDHDLSMFAPSPPRFNFVPEFELHYADGTRDTVHQDIFGPTAAGPLSTRHVKLCAGLLLPPDNALKPAFCRYLVQQRGRVPAPGETANDPRVQVREVRFIGLIQWIAPFATGRDSRSDRRSETASHTVYQCRFPEPLVRVMGSDAG